MWFKHGESYTPVYRVWLQMRARCNNPGAEHYNRYGGRGIKVCTRWDDFMAFKEDMGKRPKGFTIERIDNSKGYGPDNCKWASRKEQSNNRDCNVRITYKGMTKTAMQWAEETGLHYNTINGRLALGWKPRKIFSEYKQTNLTGLAIGGLANALRQQARTHCKHGHEFTPDNTGSQTSAKGTPSRYCKACRRKS
tara:strand:- start:79 stop:660 length:582 start_codon:yes stop_codon:yes gene_type:complete